MEVVPGMARKQGEVEQSMEEGPCTVRMEEVRTREEEPGKARKLVGVQSTARKG